MPDVSVPLLRRARSGDDSRAPSSEPVTVTVARVVRPDQREAFERWADDVLRVASGFPGNLGASLLHPGPDSSEYHLVYRFVDDASLAAWERSSERRSALAHVEDMVDDERYARVAGLESFFTRSATPGPRWRLTLLTVVAVFAITSLLQQFVMPHLAGWPLELRLLLSAVVVVTALGNVVMPALTRLFARWLHPARH
jgi:antibiotic biosynthesis monooxygenase (ABM) superfamily enzyme